MSTGGESRLRLTFGGRASALAHEGAGTGAALVREMQRAEGRLLTLRHDAVLWHDEMDRPPCGLLVAGILRHQRYELDGRRRIVNLVLPGELLDAASVARRGYTVEAATQVAFLRLCPAAFDRLRADRPEVRAALLASCQAQLDRLRWLTWTILALGIESRLCAFLDCAARAMPVETTREGRTVLTLVLCRRDMADLLMTSVESVCRVLKGLERSGVIRMQTPTRVEILDPDGLAARGRGGRSCPASGRSNAA